MDLLGRQEGDVRRQERGSLHYSVHLTHPCAHRARGKAMSQCTKEREEKRWKEGEGREQMQRGIRVLNRDSAI